VDKEVEKFKPTWNMVAGTAAHSGLEYALKEMIAGRQPKLVDMMMASEKSLGKEWAKGVEMSLSDQLSGADKLYKEMARKKAERCLVACTKGRNAILPDIRPVAAEKWLEMEWRPGVLMRGKVDMVDMVGEVYRIRDLKVGGPRTPDGHSAASSVQLPIYKIMVKKCLGLDAVFGRLDHFVDSKRPHFTPREIKIQEHYERAVGMRVDRTIDAILAGHFPPGDPYWVCNSKRCKYHATCPMGAGVKSE
jgi:hypothetical protein